MNDDHNQAGPPGRGGDQGRSSAETARARMAAGLRARGRAISQPVQDAFAQVPRHLFVPEVSEADAYRDEALVLKCGPDGVPLSSCSQPAMMAIMLEQLDLQPGHRVLEIGTGSGYNAALMSLITGPGGRVTTIDIDPELVSRARASLAAAGFGAVDVQCADGGYGDPAGAPFDRIIVTAGAWDIAPAWLEQLTQDGRLVLPLSVCGIELSVALERSGDGWVSASACRCGFVAMMGAFARPQLALRLGGPDVVLVQVTEDIAVDAEAVRRALAAPFADVETGLRVADQVELADLDLWLTLTEPGLCRLVVLTAATEPGQVRVPGEMLPIGGMASHVTEPDKVGVAALLPGGAGPGDEGSLVSVRGYGPGGDELAGYLAARALSWAELGRPGTAEVELRVWTTAEVQAETGAVVIDRPSARIGIGWRDRDPR
jgi:protein-L-isoaspartate(D-aspartate) O-methyltransferase